MLELLSGIRWKDVLDVALVAVFIWAAFAWLRRTRSRLALTGVLLLTGVYLAARQLELQLTVWILQGFFTVLVFVLVVVFQEDLRRIFEQIALWGLRRQASSVPLDVVDMLVRAVVRQARTRTGALYVIPGREALDRHLEGGIELDGKITETLLLSLFEPSSPGHDGAAILDGSRIHRFAVHLPLSSRKGLYGGTRHAAAAGLAERSDALCVVVSEERGVVSLARSGILRPLDSPEELGSEVRAFLDAAAAASPAGASWRAVAHRWREALAAVVLAALAWVVLVPGSNVIEDTRRAAVAVENLPQGYRLVSVDPPEVEVLLTGPRRRLPDDPEVFKVRIDADLVELGRRTFRISPAQVDSPPGVMALGVEPQSVKLSVQHVGEEKP